MKFGEKVISIKGVTVKAANRMNFPFTEMGCSLDHNFVREGKEKWQH
ncbi:hypothetical protein [Paenibacillus sp. BT-177]|nr:hypothetical protein [Paenibacillus sp. BT-177]